MDVRNEKSKKAIRQALIRLSRVKPYSEISVRELCREAGVSRSTFYNNYNLFNDVIEEMSEEYMKKIRGKKITREFLKLLLRDEDELKLLVESGVFGRDFSLYLREIVHDEIAPGKELDPWDIEVNVATLYHAFGIFGVLKNLWEFKAEPEVMSQVYSEGINTLMNIISDFTEKETNKLQYK